MDDTLMTAMEERRSSVAIVGLGTVGTALALHVSRAGYRTVGVDVNPLRIAELLADQSIQNSGRLELRVPPVGRKKFDIVVVCVPTPLTAEQQPDLGPFRSGLRLAASLVRFGGMLSVESSTYPGSTEEVAIPILEERELIPGKTVHLVYSPERIDPGRVEPPYRRVPKVVSGCTASCLGAGVCFYGSIFDCVVRASTIRVAELEKLFENTFRLVNVALANELAEICRLLGVDVWEVIDVCCTKPYGFMRFEPGVGAGGHCIPVDPRYLEWKVERLGWRAPVIAASIASNRDTPRRVARRAMAAARHVGRTRCRVLIVGVSYKPDVSDIRESAAIALMGALRDEGCDVEFHDPWVPSLMIQGQRYESRPLSDIDWGKYSCVVLAVNHSNIDYTPLKELSVPIVDTGGVLRDVVGPCGSDPVDRASSGGVSRPRKQAPHVLGGSGRRLDRTELGAG